MLSMIEEIGEQNLPKPVIEKAIALVEAVGGDTLVCGDSDCVEGFWIETHTLGCREAADTPEEFWHQEHQQFFEHYLQDDISIVIGDFDDPVFITITPTVS